MDVVHINSEFADQVSDHDPVLAQFSIEPLGQVIDGTPHRDTLTGTPGRDTLTGGLGRDLLSGGASADRFVYTSVLDAVDTISGFTVGSDSLVVTALLASVGYHGGDAVADGYFAAVAGSGRTTLTFDADGAAGIGLARPLVVLVGVAVSDAHLLIDPVVGA